MDSSTDPLALEEQVCFAVAVASRSIVGLYRPILEPLGLTHPQFLVMAALWENGELSVGELGRLLRLDSATLSPLLTRLEAADLVQRVRREDDGRVVDVQLTQEGRDLRARAVDVPRLVRERIGLDESEIQALRGALFHFLAAADDAHADA